MPTADRRLPLEGVRVLDMTRFVAGPFCTSLLADQGAEVVKLERPEGEENRVLGPMVSDEHGGPVSSYFLRFAKNKKSICLDLKRPEAGPVLRALLTHSDVLVENFRPGVLERMGLDWPSLQAINERLIYCTITGFGYENSPLRERGAFTPVVEAMAAAMIYHTPDAAPTIAGYPVGDIFPAALAAAGISMALYRREADGQGARIDMAMFDGMLAMNERAIGLSTMLGRDLLPGIRADIGAAPSGVFPAKDGFVSISVVGEVVWARFCRVLDRPDWAADQRLTSGPARSAHEEELAAVVTEWLSGRTRGEAVELLTAGGVPAAEVARPGEITSSAQARARDMIVQYPAYEGFTPTVTGNPIRFAGEDRRPAGPAPAAGEHTAEILREWAGLEPAEVESLLTAGVAVQRDAR
jgi:CoA:oxalate CoA-transferase